MSPVAHAVATHVARRSSLSAMLDHRLRSRRVGDLTRQFKTRRQALLCPHRSSPTMFDPMNVWLNSQKWSLMKSRLLSGDSCRTIFVAPREVWQVEE